MRAPPWPATAAPRSRWATPTRGQRRSVARSDAHCAAAEQLWRAAEPELAAADALPGAVLRQSFSGAV